MSTIAGARSQPVRASGSNTPGFHPLVPLPSEVLVLLRRYEGDLREPHPDELIAAFTQAQSGVVARRQLLACGLTKNHIHNRQRRRQLVVRFRGVYAPGHLHISVHGHRTAAVLAVPRSALTHGSSTALHGLGGATRTWHLTVSGGSGYSPSSELTVHSSTTLAATDLCVIDGVPCTTVARSIVDAADHLSPRRLANVLAQAERADLLHVAAVREVLDRTRTRPTRGHAALSAALNEHLSFGGQLTRSEVESALHEVASRAGLPTPMMNRLVAGDEVDALWPAARVGIEIDSWQFHRDRRSFVTDRAKLRRLLLQGFVVLPYAAADIAHRPGLVAAELRAALAGASASRFTSPP